MKSLMALSLLVILAGCTGITGGAVIKSGSRVTLDYTGTLSDGTIFDSSIGGEPLVFTLGNGELIAGFEEAVIGLSVGEVKTFTILPGDAYGEYYSDFIVDFDKAELFSTLGEEPVLGMILQSSTGLSTVIRVTDEVVTLDFNHPLAGESLTFTVKILSIN